MRGKREGERCEAFAEVEFTAGGVVPHLVDVIVAPMMLSPGEITRLTEVVRGVLQCRDPLKIVG